MSKGLPTGVSAPDFTLQGTEGKPFTLSNRIGENNIILLFFPLAFSGVCTDEMCYVRDTLSSFDKLNAEVIGISVDSFFALREFKKANNLNFRLVSDFNKETASKYDVLDTNFFGMNGVAKRSVFIIGRDGMIRYSEVLKNADNLPDFDSIQATLQKLS